MEREDILIKSLRDEAATLFCEDPDTTEALDQYARGLLSGGGLIHRLAFNRECAAERARREAFDCHRDEACDGDGPGAA